MTTEYATEVLDENDDDGTMPQRIETLRENIIGRRIVSVEKGEWEGEWYGRNHGHIITLDDGKKVRLADNGDCCAYTELESFLLHPERIDHVITGVGTTDGFTTWHIYADMGDVLEMKVGWSAGNTGYYGYGFDITVTE